MGGIAEPDGEGCAPAGNFQVEGRYQWRYRRRGRCRLGAGHEQQCTQGKEQLQTQESSHGTNLSEVGNQFGRRGLMQGHLDELVAHGALGLPKSSFLCPEGTRVPFWSGRPGSSNQTTTGRLGYFLVILSQSTSQSVTNPVGTPSSYDLLIRLRISVTITSAVWRSSLIWTPLMNRSSPRPSPTISTLGLL